jgi:hypothetical protein
MRLKQERGELIDIEIRSFGYRRKAWSNVGSLDLIIRDNVAACAPAPRQSRTIVRVGSSATSFALPSVTSVTQYANERMLFPYLRELRQIFA